MADKLYSILYFVLLTLSVSGQQLAQEKRTCEIDISMKEIVGKRCPTTEDIEKASKKICQKVSEILHEITSGAANETETESPCGGPGWKRVAFLNMTDSTQSCPSGLKLTSYSKRACQSTNLSGGCSTTTFSVGGKEYSQVCGRMRGYQVGSTSGFARFGSSGIESRYVEGVSLTHGASGSRQHIWTFAAGIGEGSQGGWTYQQCPCDAAGATAAPNFVGNDYFCESGVKTGRQAYNTLYTNPLWDGEGCGSSSTCCTLNNPPWFTKTLPSSTTNNIEMRVCVTQLSQETVLLDEIELYVR